MTTEGFDPFAGPQIQLTAPSTEPQREIWAAVQMGSDASCAFNESNRLRFKGPLDAAALRASVTDLVQRHEALRTTFSADGASMVVLESMAFEVPLEDASAAGVEAALVREVTEPFDLQRGPLFRARLLRLAPAEHVLVFTSHHIVCDGWSTAILLKDLAALYAARARGSAAQLPAASRYSDYARALEAWTKSPECEAARGYWQKQFATIPPAQDLPSDRPRPPLKSYRSERADCVLPAPLIQDVKKMAAKSGCSFFTALLAGFDVLAGRLSGLDDVAIGIPAAGQPTLGLDGVVGHCVNTVALRNTVSADARFVDFMKAVRKTMLDGLQHQQLTFGSLLRELPLPRDPSRLPLVSVLFNVDQAPGAELLRYEGLEVEFAANPRRFENFDLFVNAVESKGAVTLECQFNADLFDRATIVRWMAAYETLLGAAVAQPESAVSQLPLVPESERARMAGWNATAKPYAKELGVHQLVEAQVRRTPDAVALTFEAEKVTYRQLDARANAYARALAGQGVKRGSLVGISLPRSTDMVAAMLGVLKAGAAYVPLDPAFPKERLAFMAEDAGLKVTIDSGFALPPGEGGVPGSASGDDVAYVIYTSGSTGKPKGVQVPHRAVVNFLQAAAVEPGLSAQDTLLAVTTLSFDIAVLELLLPLTVGARVVIASKERAADGVLLLDAIQREGVTAMQATPSTWRLLLAAGWKGSPTFKVICGGEALPVDLAQSLSAASASAWNMYGPTETTVWSTCYPLPKPFAGPVLIGKPLANQQVHILDEKLQPLPVGVPGELYIGGDGVTLGYLHRPELTKERFRDGLYRTGDVARFRPDGNVEYLRRNDNQVKLRGFRIELGEVEAALASHPAVAQAVALVREDKPGDVRLVGYTVHKPGQGATATELRKQLRLTLPEYMLPQHFIELDAFPLTPNGKIDRKRLPAPAEVGRAAPNEFVAPRTPAEVLLAGIWQETLRVQRVSARDNFFDLGGHSLLCLTALARVEEKTGKRLSPRVVLLNTLEQIAAQLGPI